MSFCPGSDSTLDAGAGGGDCAAGAGVVLTWLVWAGTVSDASLSPHSQARRQELMAAGVPECSWEISWDGFETFECERGMCTL